MSDIGRPSGGRVYQALGHTSSGGARFPRTRGAPPHARLALALAFALAFAPTPAQAAPIGVRAKTRVELEHRRAPSGALLVGRLLDDAGQPIANERILLELPELPPATRLTDADGRFEVPLSAREVRRLQSRGDLVEWAVRFDGNARLGDTAARGTLDLSKRATRLRIAISGQPGASAGPTPQAEVVLGDQPIEIRVALADVSEDSERPIPRAEVTLEVGRGSELVGATGTSGAATFVLRPDALSGGRYPIVARFGGDTLHAAAFTETQLAVLLPTRITLRVVREGDEVHGRYRMSGRLSDARSPLAGQVVAVVATHAGERVFELATPTDADGVFVTAIAASELQALREALLASGAAGGAPRPRLELRARFVPTGQWYAPTLSASVALDLPAPPGVPVRWYLLGLALALAFVALAHALRSGALARAFSHAKAALARLLDRLRGTRPLAPPSDVTTPAFVTPLPAPAGPRARASDRLSGLVVDAHTRAPLAGRVLIRSGAEERVALTADGRFDLGPLPAGACSVLIEAPGHLPREIALQIPHAGQYDGAEWALLSVHRSVREVFADSLRGLGAPIAWGYATPREASRQALAESHDRPFVEPPLDELTHIVERTHFARDSGTARDVERARALRQALEQAPSTRGRP